MSRAGAEETSARVIAHIHGEKLSRELVSGCARAHEAKFIRLLSGSAIPRKTWFLWRLVDQI